MPQRIETVSIGYNKHVWHGLRKGGEIRFKFAIGGGHAVIRAEFGGSFGSHVWQYDRHSHYG